MKNFAKIENLWYFGVCDGHGQNGHLVSDYVKNRLALDIMEADLSLRDKAATQAAKQRYHAMQKQSDTSGNLDSDNEKNAVKIRKGSHDDSLVNQHQDMEYGKSVKLRNKRKSQDDQAIDIAKLKDQCLK